MIFVRTVMKEKSVEEHNARIANVCLIVEGAYPYVSGGVSSWVHSLIKNLPNLSFAVIHVGSKPDPQRKMLYTLPENVIELREIFINDTSQFRKQKKRRHTSKSWQTIFDLHEFIAIGKPYDPDTLRPILCQSCFAGFCAKDVFDNHAIWDTLVRIYKTYAADQSFTDFFWTFRFTYLPILISFEADLPRASVYHAVSTGFGGLLGALASVRLNRPFILTEHGIYTREREIEIAQATWLSQLTPEDGSQMRRMNFFQEWWFNMFRFMEKVSYDYADALISITRVNQQYQLKCGVDTRKLKVIPNGINVQQLANLRQNRDEEDASGRFQVGFVGRVVSIKDVKTFIHALKIVSQTIADLEAYLVGPTAEEPEYFHECQQLVEMLDLTEIVHFTGQADVKIYYRQIDVLVLTSLSEGQPLVVLEGSCAGVPVIATDVGACRELLEGSSPEDQALGVSGLITPVASPHETAKALIRLWQDKALRLRMGLVGQQRVQRYYRQEQLYENYHDLYRGAIEGGVQGIAGQSKRREGRV
jgi:glycosyltransferase involved in cell wall biosynthesis